jgi:hypothetical protein
MHKPGSYCFLVMLSNPARIYVLHCYRVSNVTEKLLHRKSEELGKILKSVEDMKLAPKQEHQFQQAKHCYICNKGACTHEIDIGLLQQCVTSRMSATILDDIFVLIHQYLIYYWKQFVTKLKDRIPILVTAFLPMTIWPSRRDIWQQVTIVTAQSVIKVICSITKTCLIKYSVFAMLQGSVPSLLFQGRVSKQSNSVFVPEVLCNTPRTTVSST